MSSTETGDSAPFDLEGILDRVRAQVEERRAAGVYPPGLEDDLESELARIVARRPSHDPTPSIREVLEGMSRLPSVDPGRVAAATESGIPGGAALHRVVARVVGHQVAGVLSQVQDLSNALWADLCVLADAIAALEVRVRDRGELLALMDSLVDRVAAFERVPREAGGVASAEVGRRLDRLEAAESARNPRPWFSAELDGAVDPAGEAGLLVANLEKCEPVLVIGPGSQAAIRLLHSAGLEVAANEARDDDVVAWFASVPDRSLGAVVAADLVERLAPQQLLDLVRLSADKLRVGGRLVANAANPRCLWGLANGVGGRPDRVLVDPEWLALCAREAGFASVEIVWGPLPPGGGAPGGEGTEAEVHRSIFRPVSYRLSAQR